MIHPFLKDKSFVLIWIALLLGPRISEGFAPNPKRSGGVFPKQAINVFGSYRSTKPITPPSTSLNLHPDMFSTENLAFLEQMNLSIDKDQAETLAGPFFGLSLFPYLAFLYFLNLEESECPKGVTVGFATCLLFVFLTIPAAIVAKILYGVSLADSDWLHGSAESLLTVTNLVTVVAFRQALNAKEKGLPMPRSAESYAPMAWLVVILTCLACVTAIVPALMGPEVHTPYLGGFMDLPFNFETMGANPEPENSLTVATWIIHISSLVEFLVAMGFAWRWADVVDNPKWKGLTWGLLPLHSSGITACAYHLLYNRVPIMVPLQALLTCIGNTTAAYAALRIALSNGWVPSTDILKPLLSLGDPNDKIREKATGVEPVSVVNFESPSLVGFEDIGDFLEGDNDYSFLFKLFVGCAFTSYAVKYGETFCNFPYEAHVYVGMSLVAVPSMLNAYKWYKRSQDPTFQGWF
jgi:hypothetical protein